MRVRTADKNGVLGRTMEPSQVEVFIYEIVNGYPLVLLYTIAKDGVDLQVLSQRDGELLATTFSTHEETAIDMIPDLVASLLEGEQED